MRKSSLAQRASVKKFFFVACALLLVACGYSQEEMDQKVRENEALQSQLNAQRQANKKCEADYAASVQEIDDLKRKFGINIDNLNQSLKEQQQANEEFRRRAAQLEEIRKRFEALRDKLKKLTQLGLKVDVRDNRMVIQLPGDVLFDSGQDRLKPAGIDILKQVAEVVRGDQDLSKREFQVAGHTDSKPLQGGSFKDNWGLSAMRARSVLVYLTTPMPQGGGLTASNWSAAGYADTDPVANNDTDAGRTKNRRVELVVLPNVEEMLNLKSLAN
jgi:chemotaxis protein MotB